MPPLNATAAERPAQWRDTLRQLIGTLLPHAPNVASLLSNWRPPTTSALRSLADGLLHGEPDPSAAGGIAWSQQHCRVVWTAGLPASMPRTCRNSIPGVCPCCGNLPVASIVRISSGINNLRYLHCSLCNTEWNVPRATCASCNSDKGLAQQQIDGSDGKIRAETCDECKSYLKIAYQEKDPRIDPVADDLASLSLDLLVDEAGYSRSGPNLLLVNAAG